jgi:ABC-type uncharacterized transport system permease subunit
LITNSTKALGSAVPVKTGVLSLVIEPEFIVGWLGAVVSITKFWAEIADVNWRLVSVAVAERR